VHGDDGRRFVNDTWGGKDFTTKFVEGETVGIGMEFDVRVAGAGAGAGKVNVAPFLGDVSVTCCSLLTLFVLARRCWEGACRGVFHT
jgi:hypothetical protein